jgi:hypothetical protein
VTVAGDCRLRRNGGEARHRVLGKIYKDIYCSAFVAKSRNALLNLNLLDFSFY